MNRILAILLIVAVSLSGSVLYRVDKQPIETIVQLHDVSVTTGDEARINIPLLYEGYVIEKIWGYHTTAGSGGSPTDSTSVEIRDITTSTVLDTLVITVTDSKDSLISVGYTAGAGIELAMKVLTQTNTPAKGLRIVLQLEDQNNARE